MLASRSGKEFPGVSKDGDVFGDFDIVAESYNGHVGPIESCCVRLSRRQWLLPLRTDCEWHACLCLRRAGGFSDHSACRILGQQQPYVGKQKRSDGEPRLDVEMAVVAYGCSTQ